MTKVNCNHCQKNLEMIDANWIFIDETKPGTADNMEWCCDKCLDKIEEANNDLQAIFDAATQDDIDSFDDATFALYIDYIA